MSAEEELDPDLGPAVKPSAPVRRPSRFRLLGLIAAGGAAGTVVRAALESVLPAAPAGIPWATLTVNVTGAFILGFLLEFLARRGPDSGWRLLARLGLGTGFLGGYTTYSTFAVEVSVLSVGDGRVTGPAYALASLVLGPLAAAAGYRLARPRGVAR